MNLFSGVEILQLVTWLFALVEVILAGYTLALNARHSTNRHVSLLLVLLAANNIAMGLLVAADSITQAGMPTYLFAATVYPILPAALVASVALLKPAWLTGRWRWLWRICYVALAFPLVVTALDAISGTQLWYTGIDAATYTGGYLPLEDYVSRTLYLPAIIVYGFIFGLTPLVVAFVALRDKDTTPLIRRWAWLIVGATLASMMMQAVFNQLVHPVFRVMLVTLIYASVYVYIALAQILAERRLQRGLLRNRLTALFLIIALPVMIVSVTLVGAQARTLFRRSATDRLGAIAHLLVGGVNLRGALSVQNLQEVLRLAVNELGETGVIYVVDRDDRVVVSSEMDFTLIAEDDPMRDYRLQAPVQAIRSGRGNQLLVFTDDAGISWWAYPTTLGGQGWVAVVQQQETVVMQDMQQFLTLSWLIIGVGGTILLALGFFTVHQAFLPITSLTETARAIVAGDLTRVATVESEDEIGILAESFNAVTARLNALIANLETRVAERTQEVERRAEYLAITGGLSRIVASILDADTLLDRVAHLISERFGFYHTGIFLIDEAREWAVLHAVSSEGGLRMLAREHRLRVGEEGIVGYVSGSGRARIALDVDEDVVWVKNPDLPNTRSEMALPLIFGQQILGVLDVQSEEAAAFGTEDIATLRILADQIAVAIRNAQLFAESQRTLRELQRSYDEEVQRGWTLRKSPVVGYRFTPADTAPLTRDAVPPGLVSRTASAPYMDADNTLFAPLQLAGGQNFGLLRLCRDAAQPWSSHDVAFVTRAVQDIAQALEVARLLEESRLRAMREAQVGEIADLFTRALDVDTMLQTAVRELGRLSGVAEVAVHLDLPESISDLGASEAAQTPRQA
ncbi:MAG: GAF domain-containing protein [Anaerolineae bacterium]|nr:GAF domain-containing protein [Anaerolineae bacterium]